ncbi:phosphoenolpyruvate--protein phosphotransferase [Kineothrix alysoides]|uniref:Phosphoenolpyruvate-protein phosphotransferase n=1 Tax=Kineothrix alysoides TaxID=1469948 RepID=A0A4R1R4D7_9FIRM|nr:phosphoenolpyruvate--protein phosphotransferase [Kineothrix alysoides]TCL60356.1 phosphoenolpyruvate--protein phosphotransferase [Kineothrix alysoides]
MHGYGVSKGLCYAKVLVLNEEAIAFPVEIGSPAEEERKFMDAQAAVLEETIRLRDKTNETAGGNAADILDVHCSLLKDSGLIEPIKEEIAKQTGAALAVEKVMNRVIAQFEVMENEYFAQRALDMKDIKDNLICEILNIKKPDVSSLPEPTIIVGSDIPPSTTAGMDLKMVSGMLMELGGITSHTAILARTLDIPAVVGVSGLLTKVKTGDLIGFDGETGEIFLNLKENEIKSLKKKIEEQDEEKSRWNKFSGEPAVTSDGKKFDIFGNIGSPDDVEKVLERGGEGIGLFRSEFLYLSSKILPDEEKQYDAYKKVLEKMDGRPVIVRTLDIGGDKDVPALRLAKEANPFLGLRALRLCRRKEDVFHTQLRALLRASIYGNLKIMFPMISSMEELIWAKDKLRQCQEELQKEMVPFKEKIEIGIMVEIPAVAVMAECFAGECDFFSIGTNDLTQYSLAVDRGNETVADLYTYYHPAVIRLIKMAVDGAHKNNIICGMCGEAAGDPKMIPLLVGMGLDEYSMAAASIPEVKEWIGKLNTEKCKELVEQILRLSTAKEIEEMLRKFYIQNK